MVAKDIATDIAKIAPPVTVSGWSILGNNLPVVIQVLTIVYVLAQIVLTVVKLKGIRDGKRSSI